ncbi:hypothetical protein [Sinosporangium siamense]|uniref:Uncharacterized protein n=1 Tax=Sinosporangium siamense TaxID=1367973 RepID=A0A919RJP4_9ACTN|nr:hypothetical protein [Sinosporangium siamense]GII94070.1 hypothetical protein Ssi02_43010 [Sinosporangium siamense]
MRRLRRQLSAVGDPAIGRRVLQETAHTIGPYAWRLLGEADRERLRRHTRLAASLASPMVPVNASILMRLLDGGQLTVASGVRGIEMSDGGFRVLCGDTELRADTVINAVNPPPRAVPSAAGPLVASLVSGGPATPHPSGGLVAADPRLTVVGDLAGGGSFNTSSIAGIAAQAVRAAESLT